MFNLHFHRKLRSNFRAFTLIELLVVVAIIAVLTALLLPSLSAARQQSKTVACLSNQRQLGIAVAMYAAEWQGHMVPAAYRNSSGSNMETWTTLLTHAGQVPRAGITATTDPMSSRSPFYCPAGLTDSFVTFPAGATTTDPAGSRPERHHSRTFDTTIYQDVWYGINASSGDYRHIFPARRLPRDGDDTDVLNTKVNQITGGSQIVLLFDGVSYNLSALPARLNTRHNNNTIVNVLLVDGHAESVARSKMPPEALIPTLIHPATDQRELNRLYPYPQWLMNQSQ